MEPTPRLYLCLRCHEQVILCSKCDHGQIYCSRACAQFARQKSLRLARLRYQNTFNGRLNHAACQARYRRKLKNIVMDHGSLHSPQDAPMPLFENKPEKTESEQLITAFCCCFCKRNVSDWIRNDFLKRRHPKKPTGLQAYPQAP